MTMNPSDLKNGNGFDSFSTDMQSESFQSEHSAIPFEREYDSDTPPTAEEWNTMKRYGSFITHDDNDTEHVFHVNDIVTVLPNGRDPDEPIDTADLWIAQIKSIRAYDSQSVWIRAKWFYHPRELPVSKNSRTTISKMRQYGHNERISSNLADFIPTSTCCGHAKMVCFDEQDLDQEEIDSATFYYRREFDYQNKKLSAPASPCSICRKAYNPDFDIMHFCPRPQCRRAWHASCLAKSNRFITSPENFLQRIESMEDPADESPEPKKKRLKTSKDAVIPMPAPEVSYASIPPALLELARQPIVRGRELGVAGNIRSVTRARTMLKNALEGTNAIPNDWAERVGPVINPNGIGPSATAKNKKGALSYECPSCGEPI